MKMEPWIIKVLFEIEVRVNFKLLAKSQQKKVLKRFKLGNNIIL